MKVTLIIGGEPFECVPFSEEVFNEDDSVFTILYIKGGGNWKVIGVSNSSDISSENAAMLKQKKFWENKCRHNNIWIGTYNMPSPKFTDKDRSDLHKMLIKKYDLE
jgi:hypothetical protein